MYVIHMRHQKSIKPVLLNSDGMHVCHIHIHMACMCSTQCSPHSCLMDVQRIWKALGNCQAKYWETFTSWSMISAGRSLVASTWLDLELKEEVRKFRCGLPAIRPPLQGLWPLVNPQSVWTAYIKGNRVTNQPLICNEKRASQMPTFQGQSGKYDCHKHRIMQQDTYIYAELLIHFVPICST